MPEVRLRPLSDDEYPAWRAYEVAEYTAELIRNGRCTPDIAPQRAEESYAQLLPDGLATPGHSVFVGEDAATGARIGTLWLGPTEEPARAWVFSIEVDEPLRGRGYGKALMRAFEDQARARGFTSVGLNVFGDNEVARALYTSLGYTEIARQMAKSL